MSKATVTLAVGARGTGKTAWMIRQCDADKRLLVWDFKGDPRLRGIGERFTDLGALIRAMAAPSFRLHYVVNHHADIPAQFDLFCRAAWAAGRLKMFVAELPEVTKANRAPPSWRRCINIGRLYEGPEGKPLWLSIIAEAQRLAEIDKSIIGNCDVIHLGRLGNLADCKMFGAMWGIPAGELATMPDLHWIEKIPDKPGITRGVLSFSKPLAQKKIPPKKGALGVRSKA